MSFPAFVLCDLQLVTYFSVCCSKFIKAYAGQSDMCFYKQLLCSSEIINAELRAAETSKRVPERSSSEQLTCGPEAREKHDDDPFQETSNLRRNSL